MRNKKLIIIFSVICGITLLIVLSSVIFSVQNIYAYCYNETGEATSSAVLANHGIKKHRNIFMIKEEDAINEIESKVPNVRVVNIERKFPNKLYINYVEVSEYLKIYSDGKTYFCDNNGKILRMVEGVSQDDAVIDLIIKGKVKYDENGKSFASDNPSDLVLVSSILSSLERLGFRKNVVDLIDKIDLSHNVNISVTTSTGMIWKLIGAEYMLDKLVSAVSVYNSDKLSDDQKKTGTLVLSGGNPKVICQYEPSSQKSV